MKLLGNRVLVREDLLSYRGHVHLTEKMKMNLMLGKPRVFRVLAKGPGRTTRKGVLLPIECEVGDRVICYSDTTGPSDLTDGSFIVTDDQILAVLPKKP